MNQILSTHAPILGEIKRNIFENFKIEPSDIKLSDIEEIDGSLLTFRLICLYTFSNPVTEIILNFELRASSPDTLYFETMAGVKGYENSSNYHGLKNDIVKLISNQIDY